uniref:Uncharacterized protein n=1 Tax=Meleagris gallopavo TaxID=9103 RepID=A0A803YEV7_MELGA
DLHPPSSAACCALLSLPRAQGGGPQPTPPHPQRHRPETQRRSSRGWCRETSPFILGLFHSGPSGHNEAVLFFLYPEAINCLIRAIEIYTDMGRFTIAAKHHISIAEIYESELVDIEKVSRGGGALPPQPVCGSVICKDLSSQPARGSVAL